jgi:hypothetical protein
MKQKETSNADCLQRLVRRLRDESALCRNETATDVANLLDEAADAVEKANREVRYSKLMLALETLAESVPGESYLPPRLVEDALILEQLGKCKVRRMVEGWTIQAA